MSDETTPAPAAMTDELLLDAYTDALNRRDGAYDYEQEREDREAYLSACRDMEAYRGMILAELARLRGEVADMERRKDAAYEERNRVVAMAARMALSLGCRAGLAKTAIEGWSGDWHGCVYIDLPTGQVSWHFHDSQAGLFDALPEYPGQWDGHDTPEKYRRVAMAFPAPSGRAEGGDHV